MNKVNSKRKKETNKYERPTLTWSPYVDFTSFIIFLYISVKYYSFCENQFPDIKTNQKNICMHVP